MTKPTSMIVTVAISGSLSYMCLTAGVPGLIVIPLCALLSAILYTCLITEINRWNETDKW